MAILLLSVTSSIIAGHETSTDVRKGESIRNGSMLVKDPYFNIQGLDYTTIFQRGVVRLYYKEYLLQVPAEGWSLEVYYTATLGYASGLSTAKPGMLYLEGDEDDNLLDTNTAQEVFEGVDSLYLLVDSVKYRDINGGDILQLPSDFYLEVMITTEKYFDIAIDAVPVIQKEQYSSSVNTLDLAWDYIPGAEEYELEYLFISDGSPTGETHQDTAIEYDFRDALRINLKNNFYSISMAYPKGSVIYRVRGIGYDVQFADFEKRRINTQWSYTPTVYNILTAVQDDASSKCYYYTAGMDPSINWTYSAAYAEDGKRKEALDYVDGSGRSRQQVTINNSENYAIVGETKYDYVGRPVVQVLPVPVFNQGVGFYGAQFNGNWDKQNFATEAHLNTSNSTLPEALPSNSKASQYYSSSNSLSFINKSAIPTAGGYPYMLTQYTNDGTEQPLIQSGVGPTLKYKANGVGNTRYQYGNPTQSELDRLFGNEAGYAKYYRKNAIIDPNGQKTIQYLDLRGKVIATTLSDTVPANLYELPNSEDSISTPLFDWPKDSIITDSVMEMMSYSFSSPDTAKIYFGFDTVKLATCWQADSFSAAFDINLTVASEAGDTIVDTTLYGLKSCPDDLLAAFIPASGNYNISRAISLNLAYRDSILAVEDSLLYYHKYDPDIDCGPIFTISGDTICEVLDCDSACFESKSYVVGGVRYYLDTAGNEYTTLYSDADKYYLYPDSATTWSVSGGTGPFSIAVEECLEDCAQYQDSTGAADVHQFFAEDRCSMKLEMMEFDLLGKTNCDTIICYTLGDSLLGDTNNYDGTPSRLYVTRKYIEYEGGPYMWDTLMTLYNYQIENNRICLEGPFVADGTIELHSEPYTLSDESTHTISNFSLQAYYNIDSTYSSCWQGTACYRIPAHWSPNDQDGNPAVIWIWNYAIDFGEVLYDYQIVDNTICVNGHLGDEVTLFSTGYSLDDTTHGNPYNFDYLSGEHAFLYSCSGCDTGTVYNENGEVDVSYHPEYCAYEFFCNYSESCEENTLSMHEINDFQGLMYLPQTYNNAISYSYLGKNYNFMNPLGFSANTTGTVGEVDQDKSIYMNSGVPRVTDFLFKCNTGDTNTLSGYAYYYLSKLLKDYLPVSDENDDPILDGSGNQIYYSIWYVLDDPDDIAGSNYSSLLSSSVISLFKSLHGGNGCATAAITSNDDKLRVFRSAYLFFREKVIYNYFDKKYICSNTNTLYTYWDGDIDEDGIMDDGTGYRLIYPKNPLYEDYGKPLASTDLYQTATDQTAGVVSSTMPTVIDTLSCSKLMKYMDTKGYDTTMISVPYTNSSALANYLNSDFCTQLTSDEVDSILLCATGQSYVYTAYLPDTLRANVLDFWTASPSESCTQEKKRLALAEAEERWEADKAAYLDSIAAMYSTIAMDSMLSNERMWMEYVLKEYHYTLYYYDQAGNLIKTIPPAGVTIFNQAEVDSVQLYRETGAGNFKRPQHRYVTNYRYNSLNQVRMQWTPDGDSTHFWYDNLGRLVASQNGRQRGSGQYSYTLYDGLGRVCESGQISGAGTLTAATAASSGSFKAWVSGGNRDQVVVTLYNQPLYNIPGASGLSGIEAAFMDKGQQYVRNRVSSVLYINSITASTPYVFGSAKLSSIPSSYLGYSSASHYSYDPHGNVAELVQEIPALDSYNRRFFNIGYEYDLVSGNVNQVSYQQGKKDEFYHRYQYDADNRIKYVETSHDGEIWEEDARYFYYPHGPLSRVELGDMNIQGLDYAYTLQGWLKAVNSSSLGKGQTYAAFDLGKDGQGNNGLNRAYTADAFGFELDYFSGDYSPIGTTGFVAPVLGGDNPLDTTFRSLYNGNIGRMISAFNDNVQEPVAVHAANYRYDQLNRLATYESYQEENLNASNVSSNASSLGYKTRYAYDPNGNISTLERWNQSGAQMDDLAYIYDTNSTSGFMRNRLLQVVDSVGVVNTTDLNTQPVDNYSYDAIGNMISDNVEGISSIQWNVQGKVTSISKSGGNIYFTYDGTGNRLSKQAGGKTTWYIRDAQGNAMATYLVESGSLSLKEQMIYGSDRLGLVNPDITISTDSVYTDTGIVIEPWKNYIIDASGGLELDNGGGDYVITLKALDSDVIIDESITPLYGQYQITGSDYLVQRGAAITFMNGATSTITSSGHVKIVSPAVAFTNSDYAGNYIVSENTDSRVVGYKAYELKNHLGNVLNTVSDRKVPTVYEGHEVSVFQDDFGAADVSIVYTGMDGWETVGDSASAQENNDTLTVYYEEGGEGAMHNIDADENCFSRYCITFTDISGSSLNFELTAITASDTFTIAQQLITGTGTYCFDIPYYNLTEATVSITAVSGMGSFAITNEQCSSIIPSDWEIYRGDCLAYDDNGIKMYNGNGLDPYIRKIAYPLDENCDHTFCFDISDLEGGARIKIVGNFTETLVDENVEETGIVCFEISGYYSLTFFIFSENSGYVAFNNMTLNRKCDSVMMVADVLNAQDYYPFGMTMPGRTFNGG
ncbi:MAG TPA: hypothetical protein DCG19_01455, partial [Cryomorphaceae bacterium]|nr:hypothetical protein [Cryomorphaceae bacterium]